MRCCTRNTLPMFFEKIQSKIQDLPQLLETVGHWRTQGERIVFTNGCFDLLHLGHVKYLADAHDLGHKLIVGINSDNSVQQLKGPSRPIQNLESRMAVLASLACVDAVVLFEEETPLKLIEALLPDVLVKGGDWDLSKIVGAEVVIANGGEVRSLQFVEGHSTTSLEQKIRQQ